MHLQKLVWTSRHSARIDRAKKEATMTAFEFRELIEGAVPVWAFLIPLVIILAIALAGKIFK